MLSVACLLCSGLVAIANLLPHPTPAAGLVEPRGWTLTGAAQWVQDAAAPGTRALLVDGRGQDWSGVSSDRVVVTPGEGLTVAAWVQALSPVTEADRLFVRFFSGGAFRGQAGPVPAVDGLGLVRGAVTVPEGADQADVSLQVRSSARLVLLAAGLFRGTVDLPRPAGPGTAVWERVPLPTSRPTDQDADGLSDRLEALLGIAAEARAARTGRVSLQTHSAYREELDLKTDLVIGARNDEALLRSWRVAGYEPHAMVGFRAGPEYVNQHPDEVQTDRRGQRLAIDQSCYLVPTANRRAIFADYFRLAVQRGARAACPEEAEFWARAGYSGAFRREWQAAYGEPWRDPAGSVANRYRAARLMASLQLQLLQTCWSAAREADPTVHRFLLTHSPLNYALWGIVSPHAAALRTDQVDAVVAQVWSGTAATPLRYRGRVQELTLPHAWLEYASAAGLVQGRRETLWLLMDPLADSPDWPQAEYRRRYEATVVAALQQPLANHYEVMPWPERIMGRVPDEYATTVTAVLGTLAEVPGPDDSAWVTAGVAGIATFTADSLMFQRGAPAPSDLDAVYGLCLPLLTAGVPVGLASLDRATDPGYLDAWQVLLLQYEALKPLDPRVHDVLAGWVRRGGTLVVLGGEDAFNAVPEWWHGAGYADPTSHLLATLGWSTNGRRVVTAPDPWTTAARTAYTGRTAENRGVVTVDLTPLLKDSDTALVRLRDALPEDGWGALLSRVEVSGVRQGRAVSESVQPGTPAERNLIAADDGSQLNAAGERFCDATRSVTYRFRFDRGSAATVRLGLANQYAVDVLAGEPPRRVFRRVGPGALPVEWELPPTEPLVVYPGPGTAVRYGGEGQPLLGERAVGRGRVLYLGLSPAAFARLADGPERLRALVREAWGPRRPAWSEPGALHLRRGTLHAIAAFERPLQVAGRYLDLFDPALGVLDGVRVGPGEHRLLRELPANGPLLAATSCRLDWRSETPTEGRYHLSQARGTRGVCRFVTGGREATWTLVDSAGQRREATWTVAGDTALLRFANDPDGLGLTVRWRRGLSAP